MSLPSSDYIVKHLLRGTHIGGFFQDYVGKCRIVPKVRNPAIQILTTVISNWTPSLGFPSPFGWSLSSCATFFLLLAIILSCFSLLRSCTSSQASSFWTLTPSLLMWWLHEWWIGQLFGSRRGGGREEKDVLRPCCYLLTALLMSDASEMNHSHLSWMALGRAGMAAQWLAPSHSLHLTFVSGLVHGGSWKNLTVASWSK